MATVRKIKASVTDDAEVNVKLFLQIQEGRGLVKKTIDVQRNILDILLRQKGFSLDNEDGLTQVVAKLFAGKKEAYYNKMLATYRQFFDYLVKERILSTNPVNRFKSRKEQPRIVLHDSSSIKKFINAINKDTFAGLRDYTLCILMLDTGIRPSEAIQIRIDDIDYNSKQICVRSEYSKTRKERYLPISIQTLHSLQKIISYRADEWKDDIPVLCGYEGQILKTSAIQNRFLDLSKIVGIKVTPYHLRHTFALHFIRNGGDAFALQRIMGHTKMDMTRLYVSLGVNDIAEKHKQATPLHNFIESKRVKNLKKK